MSEADIADFLAYLAGPDCGYFDPQATPDGRRWTALRPFMYTTAIIVGELGDWTGYSDRWCYRTPGLAVAALYLWRARACDGEPDGWHRQPSTGRRRVEGDPQSEYVRQ